MGVDQNGRDTSFADSGPDASGLVHRITDPGVLHHKQPVGQVQKGSTAVEAARAAARKRTK